MPFPFTDQTAIKKRPAVVVSSSDYNFNRPDLVLMAVTSQVREPAPYGDAALTHWKQAGLIKPSVIKPIFATIENGLILKRLGLLSDDDEQVLRDLLLEILG